MKPSRYNHLFQAPDGTWLMYNLLSKGFAVIRPKDVASIKRILDDPTQMPNNSEAYRAKLERGRFVIDDKVDELAILKALYNQLRFDNTRLHLVVFPTMDCNFECSYCFQRQLKQIGYRLGGTMSESVARALRGYVSKTVPRMERLTVDWLGGEPLLALSLVVRLSHEFRNQCEDGLCTYRAQITTNGYDLIEDACDKLYRAGITSAMVTLDGPPEMHNARRPLRGQRPTFGTIVQNLRWAVECFDRVRIRTNVDQENARHLHELLDLLAQQGLNRPKVSVVYAMTSLDSHLVADLCVASDQVFTSAVLAAAQHAYELGFSVPIQDKETTVNCWAITKNTYTVTPTGDVYKCGSFAGDTALRDGFLDTNEEDIKLTYNAVEWLAWDPFEDSGCRECRMLPICLGGCPYDQVMAKMRGEERPMLRRSRVEDCARWNTKRLELALLHEYHVHKSGNSDCT